MHEKSAVLEYHDSQLLTKQNTGITGAVDWCAPLLVFRHNIVSIMCRI